MYSFQSRVRFSETDQKGEMTIQSILDYFQDASTFHSEDLGLGIAYLELLQCGWVLSAWQIVVKRYPKLGEKIKIVTYPYDFKSFLGFRNFYIEDSMGNKVAYANSIWTFMNWNTMRPVRPTEEMIDKYCLEPAFPMEYESRKIPVLEKGVEKEEILVKKYHLDTNQHVNNGQYIRMASEFIPEGMQIKQMRAEYKKSAVLNDVIFPVVWEHDGIYTISLLSKEGSAFAVVELQ